MFSTSYATENFSGTITGATPSNLSTEVVEGTYIDFTYTMAIDYATASCELLVTNDNTIWDLGINSTVYNATLTTMYANTTYTDSNYELGITWQVNCTNSTHYLTSDPLTFHINTRGTYEEKLSDLGGGLGKFLSLIGEPVANFILLLAIIGGIVSIFMGIAFVIKKAIGNSV